MPGRIQLQALYWHVIPMRSTPNDLRPQLLVRTVNRATFLQRTQRHAYPCAESCSGRVQNHKPIRRKSQNRPRSTVQDTHLDTGGKDTTAPSPPPPIRPAGRDKAARIPRPQYAYHSIAGQIDVDLQVNGAIFMSALRILSSCVHARTEWPKEPSVRKAIRTRCPSLLATRLLRAYHFKSVLSGHFANKRSLKITSIFLTYFIRT
jgi:hypothetical protein